MSPRKEEESLESVAHLDPLTVLQVATTAEFQRLNAEIRTLKEQVLELRQMAPCEECGVVFVDRAAWGEHLCQGKQGHR